MRPSQEATLIPLAGDSQSTWIHEDEQRMALANGGEKGVGSEVRGRDSVWEDGKVS